MRISARGNDFKPRLSQEEKRAILLKHHFTEEDVQTIFKYAPFLSDDDYSVLKNPGSPTIFCPQSSRSSDFCYKCTGHYKGKIYHDTWQNDLNKVFSQALAEEGRQEKIDIVIQYGTKYIEENCTKEIKFQLLRQEKTQLRIKQLTASGQSEENAKIFALLDGVFEIVAHEQMKSPQSFSKRLQEHSLHMPIEESTSPPSEQEETPQLKKAKKVRKPRLPVTQETVAKLCEVSVSQVKNWDKGINTPSGYPGRYCLAKASAFAESYKLNKVVNQETRNLQKAQTGQDMSRHSKAYYDD